MTHLDEGTIHAWLDGALTDAEAKDVSQHAATCAQCSALIAEARGFIAGASRILTSLDDVPVGVAPKRAPVVAWGKPQRFWQAAPWVTGIAAALMLAIGLKEWFDRPSAKATFVPVTVAMDSLRAAPIPVPAAVDSALRIQTRRPLTPVSVARGAAGPRSAGEQARLKEPARKDAVDEVASAAPVAPAPAAPMKSSLTDLAERVRDDRLAPSCYRLGDPLVRESIPTGALAKVATRSAVASGAPAAAPMAAQPSAAADLQVSQIVRLDTAGTNQIKVVASLTGQPLGTWSLEGDTVRMMLRGLGMRSMALTSRVACPTLPQK